MRALVVFEGFYGNTARVADAIASGLAAASDVRVVPVAEASDADVAQADLLVVGAATHVHGLPRPASRRDLPSTAPGAVGVREWLDDLPAGGGRPAAAFDTRLAKPRWLVGAANVGIARRLRRHGWRLGDPGRSRESFLVAGKEGPLLDGETERAKAWGAQLAAAFPTSVAPST